MQIPSKFLSNGDIEKLGKSLEALAVGTLCSKIRFLAQKLRAVAREQTHTHTERKQNLETPFFCNLFFFIVFIGLSLKIRSTCKNNGGLTSTMQSCKRPPRLQ